jgi:hypothetical protein
MIFWNSFCNEVGTDVESHKEAMVPKKWHYFCKKIIIRSFLVGPISVVRMA